MLSDKTKSKIEIALTGKDEAKELIEAVEASGSVAPVAADVADNETPDATDEASAVTLANSNKAKINEVLASLRLAGIMA